MIDPTVQTTLDFTPKDIKRISDNVEHFFDILEIIVNERIPGIEHADFVDLDDYDDLVAFRDIVTQYRHVGDFMYEDGKKLRNDAIKAERYIRRALRNLEIRLASI